MCVPYCEYSVLYAFLKNLPFVSHASAAAKYMFRICFVQHSVNKRKVTICKNLKTTHIKNNVKATREF